MGAVTGEAVAASDQLSSMGIHATVAVVSSFNPEPEADLAALLSKFPAAITVEAQTLSGGLGAFVNTVIATHGLACKSHNLGVKVAPDGTSGSQQERWRKYGLDRGHIAAHAMKLIGKAAAIGR
jgi:transketolase C-terminal domain/subunit